MLRGSTANRLVRSRLGAAALLFALYAAAGAAARYAALPPEAARQLGTFAPLLLALGAAILIVVAAINPWREDRLPDRFPTIVQDAIVIALFALIATFLMQDRLLATTAVGAVVVGFALQDTLGNLFSGLAIQIDKPFRVGHWVSIGGLEGIVTEVTWRATKLRTKTGNFVIVPNSSVGREIITNYSEPTRETLVEVQVGVSYDTPPNEVKAVIRAALRDDPRFSKEREPEILLTGFDASAISYEARVWTSDFDVDYEVRDRMRSRIYYALRRRNISIPYPIQVEYSGEPPAPPPTGPALGALASVEIFATLAEEQRARLLERTRRPIFAAGEIVVREGDRGQSMFVVVSGELSVTLSGADGELSRYGRGAFFGEMSLLTGEPRTATVTAATDCELVEIDADAFRTIALADPGVLEAVTAEVSRRRASLDEYRATHALRKTEPPDTHQSFVARVRRFLRLSVV